MNHARNSGAAVSSPRMAESGRHEWLGPIQSGALLAGLIAVSFPMVLAGLEAFVYQDAGQFAYPVAFYARESFWRGDLPLWNPLNSCGLPFLAQWNTMALYPLSLFYLVLPLPWSFGVFCLGHLFLAGMGMYFLARAWTGNRLAAAVAGTAFAFNGLTWYGLMWPHLIAAWGWMPWVVLAMDAAWRGGGRAVPGAALVGAMQVLTGGAEVILLTWLFLGVLCLVLLFQQADPLWKVVARALVAAGLVAGLTAVQMLPFFDLLLHSERNAEYARAAAGLAAMPATGWANYLVPLFHCARNPQGVFLQINQPWTGSYYLGAGIVALAVVAVWRARSQRVWLLTGLTVFSLLMALGSNGLVYDWFKRMVPQLGLIRFPVKFVILASFAIPLLAACGVKWLRELPAEAWPREWNKAKYAAGGLLALMVMILWFEWWHPLPKGAFPVTAGNAAVRAAFLVLVLGCIPLLRRTQDVKSQRLLQIALVLLLWFDVFTHAPNLSPTTTRATLEPDMIRRHSEWGNKLEFGVSRAMLTWEALCRIGSVGSKDLDADTCARRLSLFMDFNLLDHAAKVDGFYSSTLREVFELLTPMYLGTNEALKLKDFLGVSHISNPTNAVEWVIRDSFLPIVTAGQQPVFLDPARTLGIMVSDRFEPLRTVYLPLEARGKINARDPMNARILSTHFSSRRLLMEVEADGPAMVVVAQAFYHPWRAYVDGKRTPLWQANYAFQALEVPSGRHNVTLAYEDRLFWWGAVVSLGFLLVCIEGWIWFRTKQ